MLAMFVDLLEHVQVRLLHLLKPRPVHLLHLLKPGSLSSRYKCGQLQNQCPSRNASDQNSRRRAHPRGQGAPALQNCIWHRCQYADASIRCRTRAPAIQVRAIWMAREDEITSQTVGRSYFRPIFLTRLIRPAVPRIENYFAPLFFIIICKNIDFRLLTTYYYLDRDQS